MSQINDSNRSKSRNKRHEEHSDEKAYRGEGVQKATKRSFCERCEVNCNNKKNLEDIK